VNKTTTVRRQPHVAVFLDTAGSYGRGLMEGIAKYLDSHGPWSVFIQTRATGQFDLAWLRRWKGDGALAFVEQRDIAVQLHKLRIPLVETYGHLPDLRIPRVGNDEQAIGRLAAEHLLDRRFEHFALSGYREQAWCSARKRLILKPALDEAHVAGFQRSMGRPAVVASGKATFRPVRADS